MSAISSQSTINTSTIRFRRWSRKGYAIFSGLSKQISIGRLSASIAEISLQKTRLKIRGVGLFAKSILTSQSDSDAPTEASFSLIQSEMQGTAIVFASYNIAAADKKAAAEFHKIIFKSNWSVEKKPNNFFLTLFLFKLKTDE